MSRSFSSGAKRRTLRQARRTRQTWSSALLACERLEPRRMLAAFTAGDLAVIRLGDGTAALGSTTAAVFIDEYSPNGTLVQSIPIATADNGSQHALTIGGTAGSEGNLNLSVNGQFLTFVG